MDGISRTVGVGPTVTLGGRSLTVSGKILRHYAEIEAQIMEARGNPFDLIRQLAEAMPDRHDLSHAVVAKAFVEAKSWRMVTIDEIGEWLDGTMRGRCFRTWLAVRDNDRAALTLEAVTEQYADEYERILHKDGPRAAEDWDTGICRAIDTAEGSDELGNSNTSPSTGAAAELTEQSPGTRSSESSSKSADGTLSGSVA